jgi:hypothetical protein
MVTIIVRHGINMHIDGADVHVMLIITGNSIVSIMHSIMPQVIRTQRATTLPSSYQLHHLVLRHLSQVVKNPPYSGIRTGDLSEESQAL